MASQKFSKKNFKIFSKALAFAACQLACLRTKLKKNVTIIAVENVYVELSKYVREAPRISLSNVSHFGKQEPYAETMIWISSKYLSKNTEMTRFMIKNAFIGSALKFKHWVYKKSPQLRIITWEFGLFPTRIVPHDRILVFLI